MYRTYVVSIEIRKISFRAAIFSSATLRQNEAHFLILNVPVRLYCQAASEDVGENGFAVGAVDTTYNTLVRTQKKDTVEV